MDIHLQLHYFFISIIMFLSSLFTGPFFLVLVLNQQRSQLLRLKFSDCSTFRNICDFHIITDFCIESVECFPGVTSKFLFKTFVTITGAPIITGITIHFMFRLNSCI